MPIKFNWKRGKNLGIALFLSGISGLIQALIFVPIGQYILKVGSLYVVIFIPIGATLAIMYAMLIIYETNMQNVARKYGAITRAPSRSILGFDRELIFSMIISLMFFGLIFIITYEITKDSLSPINVFMLSECVGGISVLIIASIIEELQVGIKKD